MSAGRYTAGRDDGRVARDGGDLGNDRERAHRPGVPGGVVALCDDRIHARLELALRLTRLAHQAEHLDPALVRRVEYERRAAEAGGDHRHALLEEHVELRARHLLI